MEEAQREKSRTRCNGSAAVEGAYNDLFELVGPGVEVGGEVVQALRRGQGPQRSPYTARTRHIRGLALQMEAPVHAVFEMVQRVAQGVCMGQATAVEDLLLVVPSRKPLEGPADVGEADGVVLEVAAAQRGGIRAHGEQVPQVLRGSPLG